LGHHCDELEQLKKSQIRFPPNGKSLAGLGISCVHADKVVSVHDSVDESVQTNGEVDISIVENTRVEPVEQENGKVVVDMEERKLSPLLAQNNKNGIPKVPDFGNIEQPQKVCNRRVILAVGIAWHNIVTAAVSQQESLDCHVCAKHDLGNIVNEFDRIRVDGIPALHDAGSNDNEQEISNRNAECGGKVHQRPSLCNECDDTC
jgi:hypothetical protein